jgi:hypothetical protein
MYLLNTKASPVHVDPVCDMDMSSRFEVKNGVLTSLSAGMGSTNVASSKIWKETKTCLTALPVAAAHRITSHHPTDHDRTSLLWLLLLFWF